MEEYTKLLGLKAPKRLTRKHTPKLGSSRPRRQTVSTCPIPDGPMPPEFSWARRGAVTRAKLQNCNDCFVFSTIAALESAYLLKHGKTVDMSEQAVNDCLNGCEGGWITKSYDWMKKHGTVDQVENSYKGEAKPFQYNTKQCKREFKYTMQNYCYWEKVTTQQLKAIVYYYGPASIGMDSEHSDFRFVRNRWASCSVPEDKHQLDHALLLIGWTKTDWIIKNSWGTDWGRNGVFYIPRKNDCGVKMFAAVPKLGQRD